MCGITGFFHFDSERKVSAEKLKAMADTLYHRGPDGEGFFIQNNVGLGHRRLAIIDLNTGDQPMHSEDNDIALVFNGEIYNYIELREELKKSGFQFRTTSDTEVIINSYRKWGLDCQQKFNGCWAFALWDEKKKQLLLSRDRIGEKPLHYAVQDNTFIFGSEIKSLHAYGFPKEIAEEMTGIFLTFGYMPGPYSFFKNIKKLEPGHFLVVNDKGYSITKYWELPQQDEKEMLTDSRKVYEEFESLFTDSVKIRMRSDVPYGAFLSGGLDSSSIVAIMSEISSFPVETFTIGYEEKSFDERDLAKLVAEKFRTNHHAKTVQQGSFEDALEKIVYHYDEPFGDSSAIPTGYVSKYAREKVKMVLTGDGGDEVLSGYNSYVGVKLTSMYQKLPSFLRNEIPPVIGAASRLASGELRYKLNRVHNVCHTGNLDFLQRNLEKMAWTNLSDIRLLITNHPEKQFPPEDYLTDLMKGCSFKDDFYKMMYLQFYFSLPDDMLVKVDRMSLAYSLEARVPFLDHRLVEFMAKVHKKVKLPGFNRKNVLKKTLGKKLPQALLNAPKKGFEVPVREWFKDDIFESKLSSLSSDLHGLNKEVIDRIVKNNSEGDSDNGNFIWMLFVLKKILNR